MSSDQSRSFFHIYQKKETKWSVSVRPVCRSGSCTPLKSNLCRERWKTEIFVVMITDGVLDALPVGEQDLLMETIIGGTTGGNPKELAHHILEQVLNWTGEEPMDDMTVLAVGIWNCQDTCILGTDSV